MPVQLYLVESPQQVAAVKAVVKPGDHVLAFDGIAQHALSNAGVASHRIDELYTHDELWPRYPGTNEISRKIVDVTYAWLQKEKIEGAELFPRFYHTIRVATDQVLHFSFLIRKAMQRWPDANIVCGACSPLTVDSAGLFSPHKDILAHILDAMGISHTTFSSEAAVSTEGAGLARTTFSFGQPKAWLRPLTVTLRNQKATWKLRKDGRPHILSVSCRELDLLADELTDLAVIQYRGTAELREPTAAGCVLADRVLAEVLHDSAFRVGEPYGIYIGELLKPALRLYVSNLLRLAKLASRMARQLATMKIGTVVVSTLSPLHLPAALFDYVAKQAGVPVVCWMHGGYGAYPSLPGYDETDFRLGKHHLVYGQAVADCLADKNSVLRRLRIDQKQDIAVCGAPYLERLYKGASRRTDKPKVVLTIGSLHQRNHFYFGYNRPYNDLSCYEAHERLIKVLAPFSDRYEIIIKDYPSADPQRLSVWKDLTRPYPKVRIVSAEDKFSNIIRDASAVVHVWVSTTFVETLMTPADILLFDDSEMTDCARDLLSSDIVFRSQLDEFVSSLEAYLTTGKFGQQKKKRLLDYFAGARGGDSDQVISRYLAGLATARVK